MTTVLGQIVIVSVKDGRRFIGRLVGVDAKKTLMMDDVLEELPEGLLSPTAKHLEALEMYSARVHEGASLFVNTDHIKDEDIETEFRKKFTSNKIKHLAVVIPGDSIVKVVKQVPQPISLEEYTQRHPTSFQNA